MSMSRSSSSSSSESESESGGGSSSNSSISSTDSLMLRNGYVPYSSSSSETSSMRVINAGSCDSRASDSGSLISVMSSTTSSTTTSTSSTSSSSSDSGGGQSSGSAVLDYIGCVAPPPTEIKDRRNSLEMIDRQPLVESDYLRLKLSEDHPGVVEYRVRITPHISNVKQRRSLLSTEQSKKILGSTKFFDEDTLFLPFFLPHDMTYETSLKDDESRLFTVNVTYNRIRPISECAKFYVDMLRLRLRKLKFKEIDGLQCDENRRIALDQHRVEVWPGIRFRAEVKEEDVRIRVASSNAVLGQDSVLDHLSKMEGAPFQVMRQLDQLIVKRKVFTKYDLKSYLINNVAWNITPESKYWSGDNVISFKDNVKRKHKVSLTNVDAPMLIALGKRLDEELGLRYITLIPECCHIIGLTDAQKGNKELIADVTETVKSLNEQKDEILNTFLDRLLGDVNVAKHLDVWGLRLERTSVRLSVAVR